MYSTIHMLYKYYKNSGDAEREVQSIGRHKTTVQRIARIYLLQFPSVGIEGLVRQRWPCFLSTIPNGHDEGMVVPFHHVARLVESNDGLHY
jgi:hypothetical protein